MPDADHDRRSVRDRPFGPDLGPGVAVGEQQPDLGPAPSAWFVRRSRRAPARSHRPAAWWTSAAAAPAGLVAARPFTEQQPVDQPLRRVADQPEDHRDDGRRGQHQPQRHPVDGAQHPGRKQLRRGEHRQCHHESHGAQQRNPRPSSRRPVTMLLALRAGSASVAGQRDRAAHPGPTARRRVDGDPSAEHAGAVVQPAQPTLGVRRPGRVEAPSVVGDGEHQLPADGRHLDADAARARVLGNVLQGLGAAEIDRGRQPRRSGDRSAPSPERSTRRSTSNPLRLRRRGRPGESTLQAALPQRDRQLTAGDLGQFRPARVQLTIQLPQHRRPSPAPSCRRHRPSACRASPRPASAGRRRAGRVRSGAAPGPARRPAAGGRRRAGRPVR